MKAKQFVLWFFVRNPSFRAINDMHEGKCICKILTNEKAISFQNPSKKAWIFIENISHRLVQFVIVRLDISKFIGSFNSWNNTLKVRTQYFSYYVRHV
jgi:hypothetical protein